MAQAPEELRFGDLVQNDEGYFALVVKPRSSVSPGVCSVCFVGNGTIQDLRLAELHAITLPGSTAHTNFAECMVTGHRDLKPVWALLPAAENDGEPSTADAKLC